MLRSLKLEREKYLEQLQKKSDSDLVKRTTAVIRRDISEDIKYEMASDWEFLEVKNPRQKRKETKENGETSLSGSV